MSIRSLIDNVEFLWFIFVFVVSAGIFRGSYLNNLKHGKGKWNSTGDKEAYDGDYVAGMREGTGILQLKEGSRDKMKLFFNISIVFVIVFVVVPGERAGTYTGQFRNDKQHGKGKWVSADGNKLYDGDYVAGKWEGTGFYKRQQGSRDKIKKNSTVFYL